MNKAEKCRKVLATLPHPQVHKVTNIRFSCYQAVKEKRQHGRGSLSSVPDRRDGFTR